MLVEIINTFYKTTTYIDKISCLKTFFKQLELELNELLVSDIVLDILVYIIIISDITDPYDDIKYIEEQLKDFKDENAFYLITFKSSIDYITNLS